MIILASASAARSRLLTEWGIPHQVIPANLNETDYQISISDPKTLVETLAWQKWSAASQAQGHSRNVPILSADTIVCLGNQIIGKPTDRPDARQIITLLQGKTHQVWTGVCLNGTVFSDVASVTFKPMANAQIETYLDTNDWVNVAGAYQIQKSIQTYLDHIEGDINTVIGLPIAVRIQLSPHKKSPQ